MSENQQGMTLPKLKLSILSSSEQLDLWEHASFLYHNYEWQDSANAFSHLGETTRDTQQRIFCHFNAALVLARLCDFREALEQAEIALYLDEQFALSYFLTGLIEVELGRTAESLQHFERCVERMGNRDIDYTEQRLKFVLRASAVQNNASKIWASLQKRQESAQLPTLSFIPADVLFEAPPRSEVGRQTVSWESTLFKNDRHSLKVSTGQTPRESASRPSSSSYKNWLSRFATSSARSSAGEPASIADDVDGAVLPSVDSGWSNLAPLPRARVRHKPRDAQTQYESTRELARFIRHAGPSTSNQKVTIDREYMLRLLQQDSSRASGLNIDDVSRLYPDTLEKVLLRRSESAEYGSVLDYYMSTAQRRHSMSDMAELYALRDSQLFADDEEARAVDPGGQQIDHAADERYEHSGLMPAPLFQRSRTMPSIEVEEAPVEEHAPQRRRPTLTVAKEWLRSGRLNIREHESLYRRSISGQSSPASSVQTRAPSTVSSTEIFRFGLRRK